jgi:hypothetical protein
VFALDPLRIKQRHGSGAGWNVKLNVDQSARRVSRIHVYLNDALLGTLLRPGERGGEQPEQCGAFRHNSNGSNVS